MIIWLAITIVCCLYGVPLHDEILITFLMSLSGLEIVAELIFIFIFLCIGIKKMHKKRVAKEEERYKAYDRLH